MAAGEQEDITYGGRVTPGNMRALFTPQQAAHIKYQVLLFGLMDPEGYYRMENLMKNDGGHRWFTYCLDTVARRTP